MALQGKLLADFSSFQTAVTQAEVKLRSFEDNANKVGQSLSRMTDQFSGRKIIQDATLMASAIERAGGVTKLTEAELRKASGTISEASEKMRKLGIDVPASFQKIEESTKRLAVLDGMTTRAIAFGTAVGTFIGHMAYDAVVNFGRAIVGLGENLVDLAIRGAGVADVAENFDRLTSQAGQLGSTLLGRLREGTHATVTDFELMKTVNQDLAAGMRLTEGQFGTLARGAFALAQATGGDVKTALDTMNDAMLTGRTRALALLTGKIDLEKAETDYARSLGTTRDKLSDTEKLEAARGAILQAVGEATARLGEQTDGLDERVAQATTAWGNFTDALGRAIATAPAITEAFATVAKAIQDAFGTDQAAMVESLRGVVNQLAIQLVEVADVGLAAARGLALGWGNLTAGLAANLVILGVGIQDLALKLATMLALASKVSSPFSGMFAKAAEEAAALASGIDKSMAVMLDGVSTTSKFIAGIDTVREGMKGLRARMEEATAAAAPVAQALGSAKGGVADAAAVAARAAAALAKSTKEETAAFREFKNFLGIREMEDYIAAQKAAAEQVAENVRLEFAMNQMYIKNATAIGMYSSGIILASKHLTTYGVLIADTTKQISDQGKALRFSFGDFLKGSVSDLFGGATNASGALKNVLGNIGKGIFQELGSMITGGISGLISGGISLIAKGFSKLFGRGEKGQVDDMRQAFIDQIGGWEGLNKAAAKAGVTLERVLNARTVKEYQAAIDELTAKMQFQDDAMATLRETAEKYGFTLQELGPKFAAAELDKKAQELYKDFQVLTGAGIDVDTVIGKMSGSINEFVQNSVAMGIAVPNAMKPMIEHMIKLGLLTDASGNKIDNLEESGITFAMTMSEGFSALIDEVKKLTEAIAKGLGLAIDGVADKIKTFPTLNPGVVNLPDPRIPGPGAGGYEGYASGTHGRYLDFGRGTPVMLHGRERVMTEGEGGGGVALVVNVYGSVTTEQDLIEALRRGLDQSMAQRRPLRAA